MLIVNSRNNVHNIVQYNVREKKGVLIMPIATTQSDFRNHIKDYLDKVNDENQTVLIARSNQRAAAVISQEQLNTLLEAVNAKEDSLDYTIARDKLIEMHILPDDPIVEPTDDYWNSFRPKNNSNQ
jgi:antitoxin YefM